MRYSKDTMEQVNKLVDAMQRAKVPAFHQDAFGLTERNVLHMVVQKAKSLHKIAENECNGYEYKGMLTREAGLQKFITEAVKNFGLTVKFDGDPRGYVVKLHAPKGDVYNTWGGAETGYGIG